jgi:hypothetical protein
MTTRFGVWKDVSCPLCRVGAVLLCYVSSVHFGFTFGYWPCEGGETILGDYSFSEWVNVNVIVLYCVDLSLLWTVFGRWLKIDRGVMCRGLTWPDLFKILVFEIGKYFQAQRASWRRERNGKERKTGLNKRRIMYKFLELGKTKFPFLRIIYSSTI